MLGPNGIALPSFASPFVNANPIDCSDSQYQTEEDCLDANEIWTTVDSSLIPISLIVNDGDYNSTVDVVIITVVSNNTVPTLVIDEAYEVDCMGTCKYEADNSTPPVLTIDPNYIGATTGYQNECTSG